MGFFARSHLVYLLSLGPPLAQAFHRSKMVSRRGRLQLGITLTISMLATFVLSGQRQEPTSTLLSYLRRPPLLINQRNVSPPRTMPLSRRRVQRLLHSLLPLVVVKSVPLVVNLATPKRKSSKEKSDALMTLTPRITLPCTTMTKSPHPPRRWLLMSLTSRHHLQSRSVAQRSLPHCFKFICTGCFLLYGRSTFSTSPI